MRGTPPALARYKIEPYVVAGDVYSHPAHPGRGGWSWYTGSAAGCIAPASKACSGCAARGATFAVDPCIPSVWPSYEIVWRFGGSTFNIKVSNPDHRCRGVRHATLDGVPVAHKTIPLVDDGQTHEVSVVLGAAG